MKERGFGRDSEHAAAQTPGASRGATVTKLHRPAKTDKLDVDDLVTDFLQTLDTYSTEAEDQEAEGPVPKAHDAPEPGLMPLELPRKFPLTAAPEPDIAGLVELRAGVEAELDQTLREIEARPKLSVIPLPVHEMAKPAPPSSGKVKDAPVPDAAAQKQASAAEIRVANAEKPSGIPPQGKVRPVEEPKYKVGQESARLPLSAAAQARPPRRGFVIGFAFVVLTAAVSFSIYFYYLKRSAPTANGSETVSQRDVPTPGAASTQGGTAAPQTPQDKFPLSRSTPAAGAAQPDAVQSARVAAPPPAATAPAQAARGDNSRAKAVQPPPVSPPAQPAETAAPKAKPAASPGVETQVNGGAAAPPNQPPPLQTVPAGARQTEPPAAATGQPSTPPTIPAKTVAEPPAAEATKASPPPPPSPTPSGGSAAAANPVEAGNPKVAPPAAKTEPVPLATPPEAVSKVTPIYPMTAQKLRITGTVDVRVLIDEQGKVTKATALSGQAVLRPAAEEALMKWKFKPATLRGAGVKSELVVSVSFIR